VGTTLHVDALQQAELDHPASELKWHWLPEGPLQVTELLQELVPWQATVEFADWQLTALVQLLSPQTTVHELEAVTDTAEVHELTPVQSTVEVGALSVTELVQELFPEQVTVHVPVAAHATEPVHESWPAQLTLQLAPPHATLPVHAFDAHSTSQLPASVQSTLAVHAPAPHWMRQFWPFAQAMSVAQPASQVMTHRPAESQIPPGQALAVHCFEDPQLMHTANESSKSAGLPIHARIAQRSSTGKGAPLPRRGRGSG
jgi:hypothetical protein